VELLANTKHVKNAIAVITPEETLTVTAPTHADKVEWVWCLNQAISHTLVAEKNIVSAATSTLLDGESKVSLTPPRDRNAHHVFTKTVGMKDAKYLGMWRNGKICGR